MPHTSSIRHLSSPTVVACRMLMEVSDPGPGSLAKISNVSMKRPVASLTPSWVMMSAEDVTSYLEGVV